MSTKPKPYATRTHRQPSRASKSWTPPPPPTLAFSTARVSCSTNTPPTTKGATCIWYNPRRTPHMQPARPDPVGQRYLAHAVAPQLRHARAVGRLEDVDVRRAVQKPEERAAPPELPQAPVRRPRELHHAEGRQAGAVAGDGSHGAVACSRFQTSKTFTYERNKRGGGGDGWGHEGGQGL